MNNFSSLPGGDDLQLNIVTLEVSVLADPSWIVIVESAASFRVEFTYEWKVTKTFFFLVFSQRGLSDGSEKLHGILWTLLSVTHGRPRRKNEPLIL